MIRKLAFLLCLAVLAYTCACAPSVTVTEAQTWAYDTLCTGKVWGSGDLTSVFESAAGEGQRLLTDDGKKQVTASRDGEVLPLSEDLSRILRQAEILQEKTGGVFDPTIAPLSALWDVNSASQPPSQESISAALELVGWEKLSLSGTSVTFASAGMGIDIGSVGKGYGADYTVEALKQEGATAGVLVFGGNVALFGTKNGDLFRVGIRDPQSAEGATLGILTLTDCSVVTSGAYERYFEYNGEIYHHLLDANSGYPRKSDLLSVTVVCADGAQADLMSTALWLMGAEEGWRLYEALASEAEFAPAEVVFVCSDGRILVSDGLQQSFTLTSGDYRWEAP